MNHVVITSARKDVRTALLKASCKLLEESTAMPLMNDINANVDGGNGAMRICIEVNSDGNGVGTLIDAIDIPVIGTGAGERVDVAAIRGWVCRFKPALALIEWAQAMPRQGASSGFKYDRAAGALEATIILCTASNEIVEPTGWKRFWHLPGKDKERARQKAIEIFPSAHSLLARKRDGRAEAALIALYGVLNSHLTAAPAERTMESIDA